MLHCSKIGFSLASQLLTAASVLGIAFTLPAAQAVTITESIIVSGSYTLESPSGETTTITTGAYTNPFQIGAGGTLNTIGNVGVTESYSSTMGDGSEIRYSNGTLSFYGNPFPGPGTQPLNSAGAGGVVFAEGDITFTGINGGSLAFDSNKGGSFGGAIFSFGSVTFQGNTTGSLSFTNNNVVTGTDGFPGEIRGGAIHTGLTGPADIIVRGTYGSVNISNNSVIGDGTVGGGAFYAQSGNINIDLTTTSGDVTIADNTVIGDDGKNIGDGGAFYTATGFNLTLGENTTLNAHGNKAASGGFLSSGGPINFTIGAGSIANIGNADSVANGADSIASASKLTKSGAGTLNLSAENTYTGGTNVQAGTLRLGATGARILNNVEVLEDATLEGIGTFGNAGATHTFATGATLRAGNAGAVGTLHSQGNITLAAGASIAFNLGDGSGASYSQLIMNGGTLTVADGGATNVTLTDNGYAGAMANRFDLINNAISVSNLSLTVNGTLLIAEDKTKTVGLGGQDYYLSALDNKVSLIAVPEPSTYGLIGTASLLALVALRRRQRK